MSSDWVPRTVESLCSRVGSGGTPKRTVREYYSPASIPWIKSGDLKDALIESWDESISDSGLANSAAKVWPTGTVLMAMYGLGTAGRLGIVGEPAACNQAICAMVANPEVCDARWLFYMLKSDRDRIEQSTNGAVQQNISATAIRQYTYLAPPLPEQQAIAEVLGALDDKIAANTALAATAEATIATAYIAAIRGDAAERPLLDELVIEFGEPFGGAQFSEPGLGRPLIRIRDLKTFKSQVWSTESRPREVVVTAGDVLVGMDAEFRATPWLGEAGLLNQRVLRARHATFGRALVREMLRRPLAEVEGEKSATTVIHLNKADLVRKTVDVPNADSLIAFERLAEPLYEARVALANENRTLAATRDALLPQLMSGKLRVRDAEDLIVQAGV